MENVDNLNTTQHGDTNMTTSFADLKRSRKSVYDKILDETNKIQNTGASSGDDRFWKPEVDKAGNGYAVIRFLPAPQGEELPWVRLFSHGFQGPGGWYIENSLTTLGNDDPVSEYNSTLWNRGDEAGKDQARKQKRRLNYVSNIYVVKDPAHPENEGKVFLYKYGKKIFDKLNDMMKPEFEDEQPINPFDLWEGANFKMKIRNVEGYRNYDKSEFDSVSLLSEDDDQLEKIWKSQYSLKEFLDAKHYKSYNELKAKLYRVLGETVETSRADELEEVAPFAPRFTDSDVKPSVESTPTPSVSIDTDDDDDLEYFQKLASNA
jgi:hypothetical protein